MATALGSYVTTELLKERAEIPDTEDDTLLGKICDEVNSWVEGFTGRVLAPVAGVTWYFDGSQTEQRGRVLRVDRGVRTVTTLKVAGSTGGDYTTLAATDYYLRPLEQDRAIGWPATRIIVSNVSTYGPFPRSGFNVIQLVGDVGFAAVPDDVRGAAVAIAVRSWHGRQSGHADLVGADETGTPLVSRFVAVEDRRTLARYKPVLLG